MAENIPQGIDAVRHIGKDPLKLKLATMLAHGARLDKSMSTIAEEVGVSRATCYNWMADDVFKASVFHMAQEALKAQIPDCFARLNQIAKSKDEKSAIRAVELILKVGGQLIDRVESTTTIKADAKQMLKDLDSEIESMLTDTDTDIQDVVVSSD